MILLACLIVLSIFAGVVIVGAPYVPTLRRDARNAFSELRPLTTEDLVVDLGSGDGTIVRHAAHHGARAVGYELNPILVIISKLRLYRYTNAQIRFANFWRAQLPGDTTVVYAFSVSRDIEKLARYVENEATRYDRSIDLISYGFTLAGKTPIKTVGALHLYRLRPLHAKKAQV